MKIFHEYWILSFGILLLGTIRDLCAENEKTIYRAPGDSLALSLPDPKQSFSLVKWKFNGILLAECIQGECLRFKTQFKERITFISNNTGLSVQNVQEHDSGTFTITADGQGGQFPTQTFTVHIESPIKSVGIEIKNQNWDSLKNNCVIHLECYTPGVHNVSYRWSGYKNGSESPLHFTISPKDGGVTLTCSASNNVSNQSKSGNYTCNENQAESSTPQHFVWIAAGGVGAAALLLLFIIIALSCWRRSHREEDASLTGTIDNTVYAEVTPEHMGKNNATNGMSVYETVDELRHASEKPETVYAKVSLPAHAKVSTATSSPYQQVL